MRLGANDVGPNGRAGPLTQLEVAPPTALSMAKVQWLGVFRKTHGSSGSWRKKGDNFVIEDSLDWSDCFIEHQWENQPIGVGVVGSYVIIYLYFFFLGEDFLMGYDSDSRAPMDFESKHESHLMPSGPSGQTQCV